MALGVQWGAFVDTYFAYDFGRPTQVDRVFLTQAARHNEWNVNLAFVEAKLNGERARGRFALQTGTAAQALHQGEPNVDPFGGPNLFRFVQEAYAGWRVVEGAWVDGGIFFSHIGSDEFITRDNLNYTRTLLSELSPDIATGLRLSLDLSEGVSAQLQLLNGWQAIVDNNSGKSLGAQLRWDPLPELSLVYNAFAGEERHATLLYDSLRLFQEGIARWSPIERLELAFAAQYGTQAAVPMSPSLHWAGVSAQARFRLSPVFRIAVRGERFIDQGQVIASTAVSEGLNLGGVSLGFDLEPAPGLLWRAEIRTLVNSSPVFPANTGISSGSGFGVTSLSLLF